MLRPVSVAGMSAAVMTARTPGTCFAREVSMETMRACGSGLRTFFAHSVPGGSWSAV